MSQDQLSHRPFAVLPPIIAANKLEKIKVNKVRITTEPVFIKKLKDAYKTNIAVAEKIGTSDGLVAQALRDNIVTMVSELAAEAVYLKELALPPPVENNGKVFVSMAIDRDALNALKPWLVSSGVQYKVF